MRTTLTLEDDVAARVLAEVRRSGGSLKGTINELLRLGLQAKTRPRKRAPFRITPRDLGQLRPGLSLDNIGDLLEQLEGPLAR